MEIDYEELNAKLHDLTRKQGLKDGRQERVNRIIGAPPIQNPYEMAEDGGDKLAMDLLRKLRIPRPQDEIETLRPAMLSGWEDGFAETLGKLNI